MSSPIIIDMIKREELNPALAAAGALASVMAHDFLS
jgi:hypothetical protein